MKIKRLIAVITLLVLILIPLSGALAEGTYYDKLSDKVELYNSNLDKIPAPAKSIIGNARINLHIATDSDTEIIGIVSTSNTATISEFVQGGIDKPTMNAYIDGKVIDEALENPSMDSALKALGSLKTEGIGFINRIKSTFINIIGRITSLFSR